MTRTVKKKENFRFHPDDKTLWQKCADIKHKGNLTRWMEEVLNKAAKKELANSLLSTKK